MSTSPVALIPAAGHGTRVAPLPGSKELLPVGHTPTSNDDSPLVAVSQHLLTAYRTAGVNTVYWILRDGKWDIPAYWGDGHRLQMHFAYCMMRHPYGVPFTINQAVPFIRDRTVLLGFPDILFHPPDLFAQLHHRLLQGDAEVVLGCLPVHNPAQADVVDRAPDGSVQAIHVKPTDSPLRTAWIAAAWRPAFTRWMHNRLAVLLSDSAQKDTLNTREHHMGHLFQDALNDGLTLQSVYAPEGHFLDIGTPESLRRAMSTPLSELLAPRIPHTL
jgi:glucose-1-phosphate thymidylyltransferase